MHSLFGVITLGGAYLLFLLARTIYRLSPLHPLYRVPWISRWAVVSDWYGFYHNCYKGGQFIFKISEAHKQYGPVVRVGHNELSVSDPSFHPVVFAVGYKYPVHHEHYLHLEETSKAGNLLSDTEYRRRRQAYNPMFSKAAICALEDRIEKYAEDAVAWLAIHTEGEPVSIRGMLRCMTVDIITEYAYGKAEGHLTREDFDPPFIQAVENVMKSFWFFQGFPIATMIMNRLPLCILNALVPPSVRGLLELQAKVRGQVVSFLDDPDKLKSEFTHKTVFEALIVDGPRDVKDYKLPHSEALTNEAWIILAAGFETTASVLAYGIFEAARNPMIQNDLYKELVHVFPNKSDMTLVACEKLPLLTAFVKESLRLAPGAPGRLPRIVPSSGAVVAGYKLKPGTVVSMSSYILHNDDTIFADPQTFDPSRWLAGAEAVKALEKSFVPFSRGSRGCLGKNLAMAELYICVAAFYLNYEFALHKKNTFTGKWADYFILNWEGDLVVTLKKRN